MRQAIFSGFTLPSPPPRTLPTEFMRNITTHGRQSLSRERCKVLSCRRRNFKTKWNETPPTARHVANILKFRAAHAGEAVGVKRDRVCTSRARGTIEHGGGRRFKRGETIGRNEVVCYSKQTSNSPRNIVDAPRHVYEKNLTSLASRPRSLNILKRHFIGEFSPSSYKHFVHPLNSSPKNRDETVTFGDGFFIVVCFTRHIIH